jgi:hypothetical protein
MKIYQVFKAADSAGNKFKSVAISNLEISAVIGDNDPVNRMEYFANNHAKYYFRFPFADEQKFSIVYAGPVTIDGLAECWFDDYFECDNKCYFEFL